MVINVLTFLKRNNVNEIRFWLLDSFPDPEPTMQEQIFTNTFNTVILNT